MELEAVFELVSFYIDEQVINNISFKEIVRLLFNSIQDYEGYFILVNRKIYLENEELQEDDRIFAIENDKSENIFSLESSDERLCFSIYLDEVVKCSLKYSCENEYYEDIVVDLEIDEYLTVWQTIKEVYDEREYLQDFIVDVVAYDKNHKVTMKEECLDRRLSIFQEYFSVSHEDAKKCIDKFRENKKFLNNSKMIADMRIIDDMFSLDYCKFVEPLRMRDFKERLVADINVYLENEFDDNFKEIDVRINNIYNNLVRLLNEDCEYVFSFNLILNIIHYVMLDSDILYTNGIIVRKSNGEYIIYNVNFNNKDVMVIPSQATLEYAQSLYFSADTNREVTGLAEFFGFGNRKVLG